MVSLCFRGAGRGISAGRRPGGQGEQLFSLRDDPDEQKNLAADFGYARVRGKMRDRPLGSVVLQDYPPKREGLFSLGVF